MRVHASGTISKSQQRDTHPTVLQHGQHLEGHTTHSTAKPVQQAHLEGGEAGHFVCLLKHSHIRCADCIRRHHLPLRLAAACRSALRRLLLLQHSQQGLACIAGLPRGRRAARGSPRQPLLDFAGRGHMGGGHSGHLALSALLTRCPAELLEAELLRAGATGRAGARRGSAGAARNSTRGTGSGRHVLQLKEVCKAGAHSLCTRPLAASSRGRGADAARAAGLRPAAQQRRHIHVLPRLGCSVGLAVGGGAPPITRLLLLQKRTAGGDGWCL